MCKLLLEAYATYIRRLTCGRLQRRHQFVLFLVQNYLSYPDISLPGIHTPTARPSIQSPSIDRLDWYSQPGRRCHCESSGRWELYLPAPSVDWGVHAMALVQCYSRCGPPPPFPCARADVLMRARCIVGGLCVLKASNRRVFQNHSSNSRLRELAPR